MPIERLELTGIVMKRHLCNAILDSGYFLLIFCVETPKGHRNLHFRASGVSRIDPKYADPIRIDGKIEDIQVPNPPISHIEFSVESGKGVLVIENKKEERIKKMPNKDYVISLWAARQAVMLSLEESGLIKYLMIKSLEAKDSYGKSFDFAGHMINDREEGEAPEIKGNIEFDKVSGDFREGCIIY